MEKKQLLFSSVVSHGRNSGGNYATSFPTKTALIKVHWDFISLKTLTKAETATHSS